MRAAPTVDPKVVWKAVWKVVNSVELTAACLVGSSDACSVVQKVDNWAVSTAASMGFLWAVLLVGEWGQWWVDLMAGKTVAWKECV
jgi:hypothetical protein